MSFAEHVETGDELKELHERTSNLWVKLAGRYAMSNKFVKRAERAMRAIEDCKNELENQMYRDCPDEANTSVYYGAKSTD